MYINKINTSKYLILLFIVHYSLLIVYSSSHFRKAGDFSLLTSIFS